MNKLDVEKILADALYLFIYGDKLSDGEATEYARRGWVRTGRLWILTTGEEDNHA